jgi:hypothetical protein
MQTIGMPHNHRGRPPHLKIIQQHPIPGPGLARISTDVVVSVHVHHSPAQLVSQSLAVFTLPLHAQAGILPVLRDPRIDQALPGRHIDLARNAMRVVQAGATTVPMTAQTLKVARLTREGSRSWKSETRRSAART